jgi:hypothetical protein
MNNVNLRTAANTLAGREFLKIIIIKWYWETKSALPLSARRVCLCVYTIKHTLGK